MERTSDLLRRLERQWTPSTRLPQHLVHGDVPLGNVNRGPGGETVYLDFGFMARRPRIHDVAYATAFMLIALAAHRHPDEFYWPSIAHLIEEYEAASSTPLRSDERAALAGYTAAIPLYFTALAGFSRDPIRQLHAHGPWLALSDWILSHPATLLGR
jgi:Ser/Thr protein kinase RdoA (MazF antagonist)